MQNLLPKPFVVLTLSGYYHHQMGTSANVSALGSILPSISDHVFFYGKLAGALGSIANPTQVR